MTDLLGPGAFGAARSVTERPPFLPGNAGGDPDTWVKDCSSPSLRDGTENRAAAHNILLAQLRAVIRATGVTPDNTDDFMLLRAIRSQRVNFVGIFGGSADALTATLTPAAIDAAEMTGKPLRGIIQLVNTAAVTLNGFPVKRRGGEAVIAGDLQIGALHDFIFDGTNYRLTEMVASDIGANRSPFNLRQVSFSTRATLSGSGFVTYQTGSYTKKSATSSLVISITTNSFATGTAPGVLRLTAGASVVQAVISNNDGSQTRPAANARKVFTGVAAGALSWTLALGRNDGIAWSGVINPTNADAAFIPTETTTSVTFEELEP